MHKLIKITIILALFLLQIACSSFEDYGVKSVIDQAGENQAELKKVIQYYEHNNDSLKLEAASFLIRNMYYHYSISQTVNKRFDLAIDEIKRQSASNILSDEDKNAIIESILRESDIHIKPHYLFDSEIVTADYLINNIELAFKAWYNLPGTDSILFQDFCEYILPYRSHDEPLSNHRAYMNSKYSWYLDGITDTTHNAREVFRAQNIERLWSYIPLDLSMSGRYMPAMSIDQIEQLRRGWCLQQDVYFVSLARSLGIPCAIDDMIHYASRGENHYTFRAILPDTVYKAKDYREIIPDSINSTLPFILYHDWEYCIAKMYRNTWSAQDEALEYFMAVKPRNRPSGFKICHKDVTREYVKTADITIEIENSKAASYAYLSVFDQRKGWIPVSYSKISKGGIISFSDVAFKTLLLPSTYSHGKVIPKGDPFIIESDSSIRTFSGGNNAKKQSIRLTSKYPLYRRFIAYAETLSGSCFEGANQPDFSDAKILYEITGSPVGWNRVRLNLKKSYRYLRFLCPENKRANLAEVEFYTYDKGDTLMVKGSRLSNRGDEGYKHIMDRDYNSWQEVDQNGWIGIDLGYNNTDTIMEIRFMPRSDTNYIIPGNMYELFYWDGEWISLGVQEATKNVIDYSDVPVNSLCWLRCYDGGKEERPFEYRYGRQFFY